MNNKYPLALSILSFLMIATIVQAQESSMQMSDTKPLTTEFVLELKVDIGRPVTVGDSDAGTRRFIPITGGEFVGKYLDQTIGGEVIPGGADWQLTRPDGITEVKAIYAIKTDDGAVIEVDNRGVVERAANAAYVRTSPTFKAPQGKYDWLNKRMFAGTITPGNGFVTIRVFLIQ